MRAIARRDRAWGQALLKALLEEQKQEVESKEKRNEQNSDNAKSVVEVARSLLEVDQQAALNVVRQVITRPDLGRSLTGFLFNLAARDQASADAFCHEALQAQRATHSLLYFAAYVFGAFRPIGPEFQSMAYAVSPKFKTNPQLQQFYVSVLLQRAQALLADPAARATASGAYRLSEPAQLTLGLTDLEALIAPLFPSLVQLVSEARQNLASLVAAEHVNSIHSVLQQRKRQIEESFASRLNAAEQAKTPRDKDRLYAMAVLDSVASEDDNLLSIILSKAFLLADDWAITDPTITRQIK